MNSTDYQIAKAIHAGKIKRLYCAGHNHRSGYAVDLEYTDAPTVRFFDDLTHARRVVERFNRRFGQL